MDDRQAHLFLVSSYIIARSISLRSLAARVSYDLGYTHAFISTYSKEIDALSDEEIIEKINKLKYPWWNSLYKKYLEKHTIRLITFHILFLERDYRWERLKALYRVIKMKKEEDNK